MNRPKVEVFRSVLEEFETDELRAYCEDMIEEIPDYHFEIPSSTSMKYHNKTQCQPGGQSYHVLMVGTIANYLLKLKYVQEQKFTKPKKRDCLRIAAILHDAHKTGGGQYTVHEHPILAQKWIETTKVKHDIDPKLKKYIGRLVASHSGEWTESNRSDVVLPEPENDEQFFVHLCDILGSRSNLDMIYSKEQQEAVNAFTSDTTSDPEDWTFPFGKYKDHTFTEILKADRDYLEWLYNKADMEIREPLKTFLEEYL